MADKSSKLGVLRGDNLDIKITFINVLFETIGQL